MNHVLKALFYPAQVGPDLVPCAAILFPIKAFGCEKGLLLQLDSGAPRSYVYSGCLQGQDKRCKIVRGDAHIEFSIGGLEMRLAFKIQNGIGEPIFPGQPNCIGLLGLEFFRDRFVSIDFKTADVTVSDESVPTVGASFSCELSLEANRLMLRDCTLGSHPLKKLFYDTGSSFCEIICPRRVWTRVTGRDFNDPSNKRLTGPGPFGQLRTLVGAPSMEALQIGQRKYVDFIIYADEGEEDWEKENYLLGNGFFYEKARVSFDLRNNRFSVQE